MAEPNDIGSAATLTSAETPAARAAQAAGHVAPTTESTRYERGRELGRGGMGRVVEATDKQFNRMVAIKELTGSGSDSSRRRFDTEALVTGCMNHPGVPAVHERGVDARGVPFYVMHKVEGRTLAKLIADAADLRERLALVPVILKVAQAVAYAHEQGVIHRDVKPDNVIVGRYGEATLIDWGIARVRGVPGEASTGGAVSGGSGTQHGSVVGTPAYMAPEQAEGEIERVDERSDVFAVGALLYHLLSGHAPYQGTDVTTVLDAARKARPRPVAELARQAPAELRAICERAMARAPEQRYQSAKELARALERFEAGALAAPPRSATTVVLGILMTIGVVVALIGAVGMVTMMPSLHEQGMAAYPLLAIGFVGISLGLAELFTRGRYTLASIVLALALVTLAAGFGISIGSVGKVLSFALQPEIFDDPIEFRARVTGGLREASGPAGTACLLAIVQLVIWGLARRRVALSSRDVSHR